MAFVKSFEILNRSMYKNVCNYFYSESNATLNMNLIIPETAVRKCFFKISVLYKFANLTGKHLC